MKINLIFFWALLVFLISVTAEAKKFTNLLIGTGETNSDAVFRVHNSKPTGQKDEISFNAAAGKWEVVENGVVETLNAPTNLVSTSVGLRNGPNVITIKAATSTDNYVVHTPVSLCADGQSWIFDNDGNMSCGAPGRALTCILRDEKASGVSGGANAANTWEQRDINTTQGGDCATIISLAANRFTLQGAGEWVIEGSTPMFNCNDGRSALIATPSTAFATATYGTSERANAGGSNQTRSFFSYATTTAGNVEFEVNSRCDSADANGLGVANGFDTEIYTQLRIIRL